jgi:Holliday junction resolvase RusA-like endonuclease
MKQNKAKVIKTERSKEVIIKEIQSPLNNDSLSEFQEEHLKELLDSSDFTSKDFELALAKMKENAKANPFETVSFEVSGSPEAWNRAIKMETHYYDPNVGAKAFIVKAFKDSVGSAFVPVEGEVCINIVAYKKIPKSAPKWKVILMETGYLKPINKPDYDNLAKNIGDALNDVLYRDDCQVNIGEVYKMYSIRPRTTITIAFRRKEIK